MNVQLKNKSNIADYKVSMAMNVLSKLEDKLTRMITNDGIIVLPKVYNKFISIPITAGSSGVETMSLNSDDVNINTAITYMPINTEIKAHWHTLQVEVITVIIGTLSYRIYKDKEYKEILKGGILEEGESISIDVSEIHYVFTTNKNSYLKVDFFNN